jgi:hypothetical protein
MQNAECIHPRLELQLVVPESCFVPGEITAWYRCTRCDAKFNTAIKPYELVVASGHAPAQTKGGDAK